VIILKKSEKFWLDEPISLKRARELAEQENRYRELTGYLFSHRGNGQCEFGSECLGFHMTGRKQPISPYHHITKRSYERIDEPFNLIGGCVYCHAREENRYYKHPPLGQEWCFQRVKELNLKYNINDIWEG
jgi:hypothetical protein